MDGSSKGFLFSATLHGIAAGLLLLSMIAKRQDLEIPKVFELVAGEGDNYMAREAPALGTPGVVKIEIPKAPEPKPAAPEPVRQEVVEPTPPPPAPPPKVVPAPTKVVTPAPKKEPDPVVPDFKKKLRRDVANAESKAKRDVKKQRDAEARRAAEEQKKLTKEEFDRANKTKSSTSTAKSAPPKVAKIDVEGIAKGVTGGSSANKVGGAGGKALKTDNDDVLAGYDALFKQRLRTEFEPPPGLSDSLKAEVEVRSHADGTLSGGRITKSSGSAEFDRAVMDALHRVRMPARPDKKTEVIQFTFTMRERSEG